MVRDVFPSVVCEMDLPLRGLCCSQTFEHEGPASSLGSVLDDVEVIDGVDDDVYLEGVADGLQF